MAPSVVLIREATPLFFSAPWVEAGQLTVSPESSVHTVGDAFLRNRVKLLVVPDASVRCTTAIAVDGKVAPEFSAAILGSFHVVIDPMKMPARVSALSWSLSTPLTLNATVIGPPTIGE